MPLLPLENPLNRLLKGSPERRLEAQVTARGRAARPLSDTELEEATEQALDVLLEHARDSALGPAAGYNSERSEIELVFTVAASSVEGLHKRIGHVLHLLEKNALGLTYRDSTTSRVETDEREAALA